jgi:hypothetical protein
VRQHGNLSFTRVFQAGHEVPAYQPETAYQIFMRALFNKDLATGLESTGEGFNYSSKGPADALAWRSEQFEQPLQFCYTLDLGTCTEEQVEALLDGSATVCGFIVKDRNSTRLFPGLMGDLEEGGCGRGNGSVGVGGNGTVEGGAPVPYEGGAGRMVVSMAAIAVGVAAFVML